MRPKQPPNADHDDLFRARLDSIINMRHELVLLGDPIDWHWIDEPLADRFATAGRPAEPVRFMIAMFLLKHTYSLSDEQLGERWVHDPYFQHALPHERSGMSHWRKRIGDRLKILLQESLRLAEAAGALRTRDIARVTVDTTVQPKNVTFPTDARLLLRAITKLGELAKANGVELRQSYVRVATGGDDGRTRRTRQAVQADEPPAEVPPHPPRPRHPRHRAQEREQPRAPGGLHQAPRQGAPDPRPEAAPAWLEALFMACPRGRVHRKGKAAKPYEFGVKVSLTTTNRRCKGGQFIRHATALPGNPYDGHTLKDVIQETEALTGREIERVYLDEGYRGHDVPRPNRVFRSGQKRGIHGHIKKELRRRSAIEAVIGHNKTDGQLDRNFLKGRLGDQINAIMSAVGYNFRLILKWLRLLLRKIIRALLNTITPKLALKSPS